MTVFVIKINQHSCSAPSFPLNIHIITIGACDLNTVPYPSIPILYPIPRATHIQSYLILFGRGSNMSDSEDDHNNDNDDAYLEVANNQIKLIYLHQILLVNCTE